MNYPQALEYLDGFINYEKERSFDYPEAFKLDRMRRLAKELGQPQNAQESILIAGSKGKGSTAAILSSILRMENLRVGLYTSPHLVSLRERIQFNGMTMSEERFVEAVLLLRKTLDTPSWRRDPPTYFELLTAIAFHHFREMKAHVAVLEVGLGGLYDSTNIVNAKVAGLTSISLEHTDKLGKTVSKIAVQKCGILKGRERAVSAPQTREAEAVIEEAAREREASLWRVGKDIRFSEREHGEDFQRFDVEAPFGRYYGLELALRGDYQIENACLALGLAKGFEEKTRWKVSDSAVRQGISAASWPGRLEKISDRPKIVLDGAHNADSVRRMLASLKRHFHYSALHAVLGVSTDKDSAGILNELLPEILSLTLTQARNPRALSVRSLAAEAGSSGAGFFMEEDPVKALERAVSAAGPDDLILVTGSLFLVGDILKHRNEVGL